MADGRPPDSQSLANLRSMGKSFLASERTAPPTTTLAVQRRTGTAVPTEEQLRARTAELRGKAGLTDDLWPLEAQLPPESAGWNPLEENVFIQSTGLYHPEEMKAMRRSPPSPPRGRERPADGGLPTPRVSVVTPTGESRSQFHEQLWSCFSMQTWPDKELIIVDTYDETPSTFFQKKAEYAESLVHAYFPYDFEVGLKRNIGVHLASGEIIVNFDDDDIYAPNYIETMVRHLQEQKLAVLTLSSWFDFDIRSGRCGFVDPVALRELELPPWSDLLDGGLEAQMPKLRVMMEQMIVPPTVYGYGFSYVHLREPVLSHPYPTLAIGEDYPFITALVKALGHERVGLLRDEQGICLHMIHGGNSVDSPVHSRVSPEEMSGLAVSSMGRVVPLLELCRQQDSDRVGRPAGRFMADNELSKKCTAKRQAAAEKLRGVMQLMKRAAST